jgi:AcrR family transcriptional regulator
MTDSKVVLGEGEGSSTEHRWAEVLDVAGGLFAEKGYLATSMQDIAESLGILKGSLYHYIGSKDELLFEILKRGYIRGTELLVEPFDVASEDAMKRICFFVDRYLEMDRSSPPYGWVIDLDLRYLSPEKQAPILEMRREITTFVSKLVDQGIAEGIFDPEVDRRIVVNTIFALLNSTPQWLRPNTPISLTSVSAWYQRMITRALTSVPSE